MGSGTDLWVGVLGFEVDVRLRRPSEHEGELDPEEQGRLAAGVIERLLQSMDYKDIEIGGVRFTQAPGCQARLKQERVSRQGIPPR